MVDKAILGSKNDNTVIKYVSIWCVVGEKSEACQGSKNALGPGKK